MFSNSLSIQHLLTRLRKGEFPVLKMKSPVSWDSREVRIERYEKQKFHGVFVDVPQGEEAVIHEDIFELSGLEIQEIK